MKVIKFWLLIMLGLVLTASLKGQIRPDDFPLEANPDSTNFEVYSQKGGQIKRANLFALKKYYAPFIKSVGFVPSATGNSSHLAEFVEAPNGKVYYIDGKGNSVQVFGTQDIHTDATLSGDGTSGSPLHVEGELTDDQNLSDGGRSGTIQNVNIEDGTGVSFDVADNDNDPENELQTISKDPNTRIVTLSNSGGTFVDEVDDIDNDTLNEIQDLAIDTLTDSLSITQGNKVYLGYLMGRDSQKLTLVNDTLGIENGNFVYLGYLIGRDSQQIHIVNDTLWIDNGNGVPISNFDKQSLRYISKQNEIVNIGIERGDSIYINVNDADSSVINELQDLTFNETTDSLHIQYGNTVYLGSLKGDNQDLSDGGRSGTNQTINISGGNGVVVDVADNDNDPTNEYQSLSVSGNNLTISNGNTVTLDPNDADSNPLNELQNLSLSGTVLCISGGNCITLPSGDGSGGGGDNWGTDSVVSDSTMTGNGTAADTLRVNLALSVFQAQNLNYNSSTNELSIDRGNTVTLNPNDADSDPSNELQTIGKSGSTVTLSNGGGSYTDEVNDADSDPNNEIETASNIGTGAEVYKQKTGSNFEFRKLTSSDGSVTITQNADDINLQASSGGGGDNWGTQVVQTDASLTGDGTAANKLKVDPITVNTFNDTHQFHLPDALGNTIAFKGIGDISVTTPSNGSHVIEFEYTGSGGGGGDDWGTQVVQTNGGLTGDGTSGNPLAAIDQSATNEDNTASNLGSGANVYKQKSGLDLQFRTLTSSDASVTITENANEIDLKATGSGGGDNWGSQVVQTDGTLTGDGTSGNPLHAVGSGGDDWGSQVAQVGSGITGDGTSGNPLTAVDASTTNEIETASNIGGYAQIYKEKVGHDLRFKTLRSSDASVTITENADHIDLKSTGSGGGDNWGSQVVQTDATLTGDGTAGSPLHSVGSGDDWGSQVVQTNGGLTGDGTSGSPLTAVDASTTNELQTISKSGSTVTLSNGGGSYTDEVNDADADPSNEDNTASNLGSGANVYKQKSGLDLQFRTLTSSDASVTITENANEIDLKATGSGGGDNWGSQVVQTDGTLTGDGTAGSPLSAVGSDDGDWVVSGNNMNTGVSGNVGIGLLPTYKLDVDGVIRSNKRIILDNGGRSIYIGNGAGLYEDGADRRNVGIGYYSLKNNHSAYYNVAVGMYSLLNDTSGVSNTALGFYSLRESLSGSNNVAIGRESGLNTTTGSNNTIIGAYSGKYMEGNNNVFIGYFSGYNAIGNHKLYIETSASNTPLIYGEFDNDLLRINGNLQVRDVSTDNTLTNLLVIDGTSKEIKSRAISSIDVNDADSDPTNELQTISKSGSTVTLSNGGGSFTDEVNDADADPNNEIQNLDQVTTQGNTTTNDVTIGNLIVQKVGASITLDNNSGAPGKWKMFIDDSNDELFLQPKYANSTRYYIKAQSGNTIYSYNTVTGATDFTNSSGVGAVGISPANYRVSVNNSSNQQSITLYGDTRQIKLGTDYGSPNEVMMVNASNELEYVDPRNFLAKILGTTGNYNLTSSWTVIPFGNDPINSGQFTFDDANDKLEYNASGTYQTCFEGVVEYSGSSSTDIEFKIEYNGSATITPTYIHSIHDFDASNEEKVYVNFCNERYCSSGHYVRVKGKGVDSHLTYYKLTTEKIY